jgi:hypothetical protein
LQNPQKFIQIEIFGSKMCHLATLQKHGKSIDSSKQSFLFTSAHSQQSGTQLKQVVFDMKLDCDGVRDLLQ